MPTRKVKTKRGRAQDRRLVSGKQKHEVAHVARVSGKSPEAVRNAIKTYGHSRGRLMELLKELHEVLNMILPPKTSNIDFRTSGADLIGAIKKGKRSIKRTR